jgi:hypothetical protein
MYLDRCKVRIRGKLYTRILLRQSYRHEGKVKHRTVANLSPCSAQEIEAITLALKHKPDFSKLTAELSAAATPGRGGKPPASAQVILRQGLSIGAVAVLEGLARELGIARALGTDRQGRLALWQGNRPGPGSGLASERGALGHPPCRLRSAGLGGLQ